MEPTTITLYTCLKCGNIPETGCFNNGQQLICFCGLPVYTMEGEPGVLYDEPDGAVPLPTKDYEREVEWWRIKRGRSDRDKIRMGCRLARRTRKKEYGAGIIKAIASEANFSKSSLYEYRNTWDFLWKWKGFSARRIFDDYPYLSYTHIRDALALPFEDACDALHEIIPNGDDDYPMFNNSLPMSTDAFAEYVRQRLGKPTPKKALFDKKGLGQDVVRDLYDKYAEWTDKQIRVTVTEVE